MSMEEIEAKMVETEHNLRLLLSIDRSTFSKLARKHNLILLKQFRNHGQNDHSLRSIVSTSTASCDNMLTLGKSDRLTEVTDTSRTTIVSSIAPAVKMDDPLIVMLGISEYDGLPNLDGVKIDYNNIIDTFINQWKFKIFYKLNDNNIVYTNDKNKIKNNYKLKWDIEEICLFVEQARKHVVQNRHNGLIFAISCHGDRGKVIYDSECNKYSLDYLFCMFSPEARAILESYQESKEESNHLFTCPKIFLLDMCRGNMKAKVTFINVKPNVKKINSNINIVDNDDIKQEIATIATTMPKSKSVQEKSGIIDSSESEKEAISFKNVSKDQAQKLVAQMANYCKVYANTEGFTVVDGSKHGGIFLRCVCKLFKDVQFVTKHRWPNMIFKIRDYTKQKGTIFGKLTNCSQLVENEGTLEREIVFGSKYSNIRPITEKIKRKGSNYSASSIDHDSLTPKSPFLLSSPLAQTSTKEYNQFQYHNNSIYISPQSESSSMIPIVMPSKGQQIDDHDKTSMLYKEIGQSDDESTTSPPPFQKNEDCKTTKSKYNYDNSHAEKSHSKAKISQQCKRKKKTAWNDKITTRRSVRKARKSRKKGKTDGDKFDYNQKLRTNHQSKKNNFNTKTKQAKKSVTWADQVMTSQHATNATNVNCENKTLRRGRAVSMNHSSIMNFFRQAVCESILICFQDGTLTNKSNNFDLECYFDAKLANGKIDGALRHIYEKFYFYMSSGLSYMNKIAFEKGLAK